MGKDATRTSIWPALAVLSVVLGEGISSGFLADPTNEHSSGPAGGQTRAAESDALVHKATRLDPRGDVRYIYEDADYDRGEVVPKSEADVVRARIAHRARVLYVGMRFVNLRRIGWQHYEALVTTPATDDYWNSFYVDSSFRHRAGTKQAYQLGRRIECKGMRHRIDFERDTVRMWIPRACFGRAAWVKVELNNSLYTKASRGDTDACGCSYGMQFRDNPFNRQPWADTTTRRLYPLSLS